MIMRGQVERLRRIWRFVVDGVWDVELSSLSPVSSFGVRAIRVVVLMVRGFYEDECPLHASALTFVTLMTVVPILALSLSLARVFGGDELAREKIRGAVSEWTGRMEMYAAPAGGSGTVTFGSVTNDTPFDPGHLAQQINVVVDKGFEKVAQINFAALGGVGFLVLIWMVIEVLGRVESSFNRVWGVTTGRSLWRRFTDYTSVILILPLLIVAASSLPVADLFSKVSDVQLAQDVRQLSRSPVWQNITVFAMTSVSFAFVIMFMPNTRVSVAPALGGGILTAVLFFGWLWLCATIQLGVANYGRLYGSLAVVPILLAWVQVSWEILLFGAEAAFAFQNAGTYRMEQDSRKASMHARMVLALAVIAEAARALARKAPPLDVPTFAREKCVPVRFLNEVIDELVQAGILAELSTAQGTYVLLRAPDTLKVREVVNTMMHSGVRPDSVGLVKVDPRIDTALRRIADGIDGALGAMTIGDMT